MKEIEIKILDIDPITIIRKMEELGGELEFLDEKFTSNLFYRKSVEYPLTSEVIRLRKEENGKVRLTYKDNYRIENECKVMDELEVGLDSFEMGLKILDKLGFNISSENSKRRTQFSYKNSKVVIDDCEVPRIPMFVEIESPNAEELFQVVEDLGYSKSDCVTWGLKELVEHYGN